MLRYLENVVTLRLDAEACNGCGMCVIVCPHGVFDIEDRKAVMADQNAGIGGGACAINCPVDAIQVQTGVGCAAGILPGTIGKDRYSGGNCSCPCGVSSAGTESTQTDCCGTRTE